MVVVLEDHLEVAGSAIVDEGVISHLDESMRINENILWLNISMMIASFLETHQKGDEGIEDIPNFRLRIVFTVEFTVLVAVLVFNFLFKVLWEVLEGHEVLVES